MIKKLTQAILQVFVICIFLIGLFLILPRMSNGSNVDLLNSASTSYPPAKTQAKSDPQKSDTSKEMQLQYPPPNQATVTPTAVGLNFPSCVFNVTGPTMLDTSSNIDKFVFTEPKIVFSSDAAIGIGDWLPNSDSLIFERSIISEGKLSIELYNLDTNTSKAIGKGWDFWGFNAFGITAWLDHHQSVAFIDLNSQKQKVLHISKVDIEPNYYSQVGLLTSSISEDANGHLLFFLQNDPRQLRSLDVGSKSLSTIPIESTYSLPNTKPLVNFSNYQIAAQSLGEKIALYNNEATFLLSRSTSKICRIDWGKTGTRNQWAIQIQWSPDGRFLAAFLTVGDLPVPFVDLVILDTWTGEKWKIDLGKLNYVSAMTWSPNSRNFVLLAEEINRQQTEKLVYEEFFIGDTLTKVTRRILDGYPFLPITGNSNISWSPNGKFIAMDCAFMPTNQKQIKGQLCFVSVEEMK